MSSKDKTREKLMGSMRKTKADAGITTKNKPASAAATRAAPKPAKAAQMVSRTGPTSQTHSISIDSYQSGRRVWPD